MITEYRRAGAVYIPRENGYIREISLRYFAYYLVLQLEVKLPAEYGKYIKKRILCNTVTDYQKGTLRIYRLKGKMRKLRLTIMLGSFLFIFINKILQIMTTLYIRGPPGLHVLNKKVLVHMEVIS